MRQGELFKVCPPALPAAVLETLSHEEIELAQTMPAGREFASALSFLRRTPLVVRAFIEEARALIAETPHAAVAVEEVLCRLRRRHRIRVTNYKGLFSRWLPRLLPELTARTAYRRSKFSPILAKWQGQ